MSRFASFREFYPFYLSEHRHPVSRRLRRLAGIASPAEERAGRVALPLA